MENNTPEVVQGGHFIVPDAGDVTPPVQPPVIDQAKIDAAKNKVEEFQKELDGKVYPVKIDNEENLESLRTFIREEANWKNMEALGVIELNKQLTKAEIKGGNIFMKALELDALNHFLNKVDGYGLESAESHIKLVQAANSGMTQVQADINKMNQYLVELDAAEQGIEIEPTPEK